MRKKAILLGLIGYVCGCVIGLFFALQNENFNLREALPSMLLGGIPGAIAMGSAVIYDIEEWRLLRATATHVIVVLGVILFACFLLKWFPPWSPAFWIMLAAELIGYVIIWLIMYYCFRKKVRTLNEMLKESREKEN